MHCAQCPQLRSQNPVSTSYASVTQNLSDVRAVRPHNASGRLHRRLSITRAILEAAPASAADWNSLNSVLWKGSEYEALGNSPARQLSPAWKVMLLSDGSVTRHLQIMTGAKVAVECTQMQVLEDCTGLPSSTKHIRQPLLQRQVFLRAGDARHGVAEGTALVYAASWWNAEAAGKYLEDQSLPIWASLSKGKTELYRDIQAVFLGNSPVLEEQFGRKGPFWGRQYLFWHDRKPLTVIHEVFSTSLERYLGPVSTSL